MSGFRVTPWTSIEWPDNQICVKSSILKLLCSEKVWSEPEVVEAAAWEFQDTADFLKAGASQVSELIELAM